MCARYAVGTIIVIMRMRQIHVLTTDCASAQKSSSKDGAMDMRQTRSGGTAAKPPRHAVILVTAASDRTISVQ